VKKRRPNRRLEPIFGAASPSALTLLKALGNRSRPILLERSLMSQSFMAQTGRKCLTLWHLSYSC
jgi:hypothetical protein